jgi:hypothetical protein
MLDAAGTASLPQVSLFVWQENASCHNYWSTLIHGFSICELLVYT